MDTVVSMHVAAPADTPEQQREQEDAVERALGWFHHVEDTCTRFDPESELMRLSAQVNVPVPVSALLFEAVQFGVRMARDTGGAFDPTVGGRMREAGFNRDHRSGRIVEFTPRGDARASYQDIVLDAQARTITLTRPLVLDLGALAKGLAIDMAACEVRPFENFAIDAGGDLYLGGHRADGEPWSVGIRHPRHDGELIDRCLVSNRAVCTSGDYERRTADGAAHHILDPRGGGAAAKAISATVIADSAMLADAVATAVFVMGPADGIQLLDTLQLDGLIVSPALELFATRGMRRDDRFPDAAADAYSGAAILSNAQGPVHDHPRADSRRDRLG
jgi:thiamine biosynthesis lipoprotein